MVCGFLAGLLVLATGCRAVDRSGAEKLAGAGVETVSRIRQTYVADLEQLDRLEEAEILLAALRPGYAAPGASMQQSLEMIRSELRARRVFLGAVADLCVQYERLCRYDARREVEDATRETIQAGAAFVKASGLGSMPTGTAELFGKAGGSLAAVSQAARIRAASTRIAPLLRGVVDLLAQSDERAAIVAAREEFHRSSLKVATNLLTAGVALPNSILAAQVAPFGLELNEPEWRRAAAEPALRAALIEIVVRRQRRQLTAIQRAYGAAIASLRELAAEHEPVGQGQPVTLAQLDEHMAELTVYLELTAKILK